MNELETKTWYPIENSMVRSRKTDRGKEKLLSLYNGREHFYKKRDENFLYYYTRDEKTEEPRNFGMDRWSFNLDTCIRRSMANPDELWYKIHKKRKKKNVNVGEEEKEKVVMEVNQSEPTRKKRKSCNDVNIYSRCELKSVVPSSGNVVGGQIVYVSLNMTNIGLLEVYRFCDIRFGASSAHVLCILPSVYVSAVNKNLVSQSKKEIPMETSVTIMVITPPSEGLRPMAVDVSFHFLNGMSLVMEDGYEYVADPNSEDKEKNIKTVQQQKDYQPYDSVFGGNDDYDVENFNLEDPSDPYGIFLGEGHGVLSYSAVTVDFHHNIFFMVGKNNYEGLKYLVESNNVNVLKKDPFLGLDAHVYAQYYGYEKIAKYLFKMKVLNSIGWCCAKCREKGIFRVTEDSVFHHCKPEVLGARISTKKTKFEDLKGIFHFGKKSRCGEKLDPSVLLNKEKTTCGGCREVFRPRRCFYNGREITVLGD